MTDTPPIYGCAVPLSRARTAADVASERCERCDALDGVLAVLHRRLEEAERLARSHQLQASQWSAVAETLRAAIADVEGAEESR